MIDLEVHGDDWPRHAKTLLSELGAAERATIVLNKMDLVAEPPSPDSSDVVCVSAVTGEGIETLKAHIKSLAGYSGAGEGTFMARRRHLNALNRALGHLAEGRHQLESAAAGDLLAEELRLCHECLGEITGEFTPDDLLGKIFENFCIGK